MRLLSFPATFLLLLASLATHAEDVGMAQVCYYDIDVETLTPVTIENICTRGDVRRVPMSDPSLVKVFSLLALEHQDRDFVGGAVRLRITTADGRDIAVDRYGTLKLVVEQDRRVWKAKNELEAILHDLMTRYPEVSPQIDRNPFLLY